MNYGERRDFLARLKDERTAESARAIEQIFDQQTIRLLQYERNEKKRKILQLQQRVLELDVLLSVLPTE
jgi:hypothetical protein